MSEVVETLRRFACDEAAVAVDVDVDISIPSPRERKRGSKESEIVEGDAVDTLM